MQLGATVVCDGLAVAAVVNVAAKTKVVTASRGHLGRWSLLLDVFAVMVGDAVAKAADADIICVCVDVMISGLVPFLLCPLLQGPCVGP